MIVNLTNHERFKMSPGLHRPGRSISFYGPNDQETRDSLKARGLIAPKHNSPDWHLTDLGVLALEYLESKKDQETEIWKALLSTVDSIDRGRISYGGTSRTTGDYVHYEDGTIIGRCTFKAGNKDGTSTAYALTGTLKDNQVIVQIDETEDHGDGYWGPGGYLADVNPEHRVIVEGIHYTLGPDKKEPGTFKGHSGRRFEIEFFDGRRIGTNDLWHQGPIPPKWRERYPDNARFVPQPKPKSLAEQLGLTEKTG